jgi:hypothetical protein
MARTFALAALLAVLSATSSQGTEWVSCTAPDGVASFDYLSGSLDVLAIAGLNISVGDKVWASSAAYGPGEPVSVGQAFEDDETVQIDVVDEAGSAIIARLRLFKAQDGERGAIYGGTLRIPNSGAWSVACVGG